MKKILTLLTVLTAAAPAFAADLLPQESPSFNRKVRNLGMGNVGVSILGTPDSAAFYNPAALNDLTESEIRFMTITAEVADSSTRLINDVKDLSDDVKDANTDADKVRALNNFIQDRTGEFQHLRLNVELVSYTTKNFAAGLLIDERLDLSFRDQSFPHFDMRNLGDATAYMAFSTGFWDKLLQVGMNFRPTMRFSLRESDQQITFADVTTENSKGDPILVDQLKAIKDDRQFAIPVNFGVKSDLSFDFWKNSYFIEQLKPQVGVTWEDVGSPSFGPLPSANQTLNAGFSINPEIWRFKNLIAVELREINQDRPMLSKLHAGMEVKFPWILAVRGGISQGYLSGGATIDLVFVRIDGAVYYEEVGFNTRQDGNLRYAATFGFKI
ncbi:MAG: hypothetical protein IT286_02515 [Proteobacteria bacterium]|jgi:hypothetical protein|nr:hypothetical protein [Pseudomonadota bacterium]